MLKKAKILIGSALIGAGVMTLPLQVALAQGALVPPDTLGKVTDPVAVIRGIIRFILLVAFVLAFIMLIIGGVRWILAGGDEKAVSSARNTITAALIGLVIVLVSYAIIRLVELFFNFDIISNITGPESLPKLGQ